VNIELMNAVEQAEGTKEKVKLLKEADERTQVWLRYALDPFITFGMTAGHRTGDDADLAASEAALGIGSQRKLTKLIQLAPNNWWTRGRELMQQLSMRIYTGNAARDAIEKWLDSAPSADHAKWGARVINKDLRCGVSDTLALKAIPGLFETFRVQLAHPLDPDKHELSAGYVEPKIDGLRMLVINGKAYSRKGHPLHNVDHIIAQLREARMDLDDWVFDGECVDPNVSFEQTISKARGSAPQSGLIYHVFDVVDRESWGKRDTLPLHSRKSELRSMIRTLRPPGEMPAIRVVPARYFERPTIDLLVRQRDEFMKAGYEGAMFKPADRPYEFKRSDAVLKIKKFDTVDCRVVEAEEGNGKHAGRLGALVVEEMASGERFNVGTGFTDDQRHELWLRYRAGRLIGRTAEVRYQNKTAHGKARFPSFVRFREDK